MTMISDLEANTGQFPHISHGVLTIERGKLALVMGLNGTPPTAIVDDVSAFDCIVPFDMTLTSLKANMKEAPIVDTSYQIRRSIDNGASFANAFGMVTINNGTKVGLADPPDLDVNEGDILSFSVVKGGGSGTNLSIFTIGKERI